MSRFRLQSRNISIPRLAGAGCGARGAARAALCVVFLHYLISKR